MQLPSSAQHDVNILPGGTSAIGSKALQPSKLKAHTAKCQTLACSRDQPPKLATLHSAFQALARKIVVRDGFGAVVGG